MAVIAGDGYESEFDYNRKSPHQRRSGLIALIFFGAAILGAVVLSRML